MPEDHYRSMWKVIWEDPVWSKVISAGIIALIAAMGSYLLNWWPTIGGFASKGLAYASVASLVPNWTLAVLGLFVLSAVVVLIALLWQFLRHGKSGFLEWQAYTSDVFFELRWRWHYSGSTMSDLTTFCPHCDYQVFPVDGSGYNFIDQIAFFCDSCGANLGIFEESFDLLENKARRFAQQKLRNGSWNEKTGT